MNQFLSAVLLTTVLFIAVTLVPVVNAVAIVLVPLPLLCYSLKYGDAKAAGILFLSLAAAFAALSYVDAGESVYVLYLLGACGLLLPAMLARYRDVEKTVACAAAVMVLLGAVLVVVYALASGQTPLDLIETFMARAVQESIDAYSTTGTTPDQVDFLKNNTPWVTTTMMQLGPSLIVTAACCIAWLNIVVGRMLCSALRVDFPDIGDLARWKLDDRVIWFAIASGMMILIPLASVRVSGLNMLILALFLYLLQGMAVVGFFFKSRSVPLYLTLPAYLLIFIQAIFLFAVVVVGVADIWIDFRKLQKTDGAAAGT